jgi:hypothetical protein
MTKDARAIVIIRNANGPDTHLTPQVAEALAAR